MLGGMQDYELRVSRLLENAANDHPNREIVTRWADGSETRSNWVQTRFDARRFAQALERLGIRPGDRVATLAMNHGRHLIAWYGAMGMGAVLHTINPRLFDEQLEFIANHAEDRVLLYDRVFQPIVDRLRARWPRIERYIVFDAEGPDSFEALIAREDGSYAWREGSEHEPCMLCYTSGTTGNPKGVMYSHRSSLLHAMACVQPDAGNLSSDAVAMPIVPMFHAAAWGLPFAVPMVGAKLVFSATNDPDTLCDLMNQEKVTHSGGVPTVWFAMFRHIDETGRSPQFLRHTLIGGAAAPRAMIARLLDMGVRVCHAWGMTETSPVATVAGLKPDWATLSRDEQLDHLVKQGRPAFPIELRALDDHDAICPRDGVTPGRLQVRGPWVVGQYFGATEPCIDADGWFETGDVAVIHPDGTMQITDRAKDVIKSGGEWISSVDLENAAVGCEGVAEAAAIGVPHPQWGERPLLLVVRKAGSAVGEAEVRAHLAENCAKWWQPDEIRFVEDLPHTATGKLLKTELRARYASATSAPRAVART